MKDFFNKDAEFYFNYLKRTSQKKDSAREISSKIRTKKPLNILIIGGGSGEGDLSIIKNLNSGKIYYVDTSIFMFYFFLRNLEKTKVKGLSKADIKEFESEDYLPPKVDLILCINSIYFLNGWKENNLKNPLLKIFSSLKENGNCIIVIKSDGSDHCILKKIAGGGTSTGEVLRNLLSSLNIPYIMEKCNSSIDMSDCFDKRKFYPNPEGNKLLSFMFGGRWEKLNKTRKREIASELEKRVNWIKNKPILPTEYEHIWIRKIPTKDIHIEEKNILDVVDKNDKTIGKDHRRKIHRKGILHRESALLIFNEKGHVILTKRLADKRLDFSVSGHPISGESYEDCIMRETKEELSLNIEKRELKSLFKVRLCSRYPGRINDKFIHIFVLQKKIYPSEIIFDKNETISLESFKLSEFLAMSNKKYLGKSFLFCIRNPIFRKRVMEYGNRISKK